MEKTYQKLDDSSVKITTTQSSEEVVTLESLYAERENITTMLELWTNQLSINDSKIKECKKAGLKE